MEEKQKLTIMDYLMIGFMIVIILIVTAIYLYVIHEEPKEPIQLYMYESSETHVGYYITTAGQIYPILNPDGSLYVFEVKE